MKRLRRTVLYALLPMLIIACGSKPTIKLPPQVTGQIPTDFRLGDGRSIVLSRVTVVTQGQPGFGAITNPLIIEFREQGTDPPDANPQGLTISADTARMFFESERTVQMLWRFQEPGLMAASIKPATYDGLVIAYPDVQHPDMPDSIPAPSHGLHFQPIEVPADAIVYIGDVELRQQYSFWDRALDRVQVQYAVADAYDQTVADFRARYPQLASVPVEKRLASAVAPAE